MSVFRADFSLKSKTKKGGTLSNTSTTSTTSTTTTNNNNARGRVVHALRERGDDCTRGISGRRGTDDWEDCIPLEEPFVEVR